jgi:hypothetical protein
MNTLQISIQVAEAAVFAFAGVAKLTNRAAGRQAVRSAGVPSAMVPLLALLLPVVEVGIAVLLLAGPLRWAALAAVAMFGLFHLTLALRAARGDLGLCHCFGRWSGRVTWATMGRNAVLSAGAMFLWWCATR